MKRVWCLFVIEAACQAVQPMIGNVHVYPETAIHDTRRAEPFIMPMSGTIQTISIYHEGGSGQMLLGVYLGEMAPDVLVGVTMQTLVLGYEGWQTVALASPLWVPEGTRVWLAWVFDKNPGVRFQRVATGWVESDQDWSAGMPSRFGACWRADHKYSICASYSGDVHPVINEILPRNDTLSEREFLDEDWTKQGWIELFNPSNLPIDLGAYSLSNKQDAADAWFFPNMVLGPREFLRVWTSGKNRSNPHKELHTSFSLLDSEGVVLRFCARENRVDVLEEMRVPVSHSYGRYPDGAREWYFYAHPTPGSANPVENRKRFMIDQRHSSLTVGVRHQLTVTPPEERVRWSSDNPLVWVDSDGGLLAVQDAQREKARATITASSLDGNETDSCQVTVVNWTANSSELKVVGTPYASYVLGSEGTNLFYTIGRNLYVTSDGFAASQFLSTLPENMDLPKMLITPFGYFIQCNKTIFESADLVNWSPSFTMNMRSLDHSLAHYWNPESQTGYVYAGEYSSDPVDRHRVCRGTFSATGEAVWDTVLDFPSINEWLDAPSNLDVVRHVHTVAVDPYTGHVWVGTGDIDIHSKLLCSDDNGESFRLVGLGSQAYRTLSIWFTQRYVYWSMDAYYGQSCWRIPRSQFERAGFWPCMTPEMIRGTTRAGLTYLVTAAEASGHFPVPVGQTYLETEARALDERNSARAINDPEYDYKEKVVELFNGTLWYHLWVQDDRGDPVLILGQAAEGAYRDFRARVFGIKERPDGGVDVQELLSVPSTQPDRYDASTMYVQLEPKAQDADGHIYFTGRTTDHRCYKTRLTWVDDPSAR